MTRSIRSSSRLGAALLLAAAAAAQTPQPPQPPPGTGAIKLVAPRQDPAEQTALAEKLAAKQKLPVFTAAPWQFDYDAARAQAKRENKLLLAYFTRSYAH